MEVFLCTWDGIMAEKDLASSDIFINPVERHHLCDHLSDVLPWRFLDRAWMNSFGSPSMIRLLKPNCIASCILFVNPGSIVGIFTDVESKDEEDGS
jgi:hypothetical protein